MKDTLIIPLAGYGRKFVNDGYRILKPFLKIDDDNIMITQIIDKFPKRIKKIFIVRSDLQKNYIDILKKIENSELHFIKPHNLGPLHSIYSIKKVIKNLKNIYISYCDIDWVWNKTNKVKSKKSSYVFCFKGYHPFTQDNNNYAFCKVQKNKFLKIKEKESFTKKWQSEPLSVGLFYFVSGSELINCCEKIFKHQITINNEYFPSLLFNFIKNKKVKFVKNFTHIGKPIYYEIFKKWKYYSLNKNKFKKKIKKSNFADEILIPAAGLSKRFQEKNIKKPKFLINLADEKKTMIDLINENLKSKKKINLITLNKYDYDNDKFKVYRLNNYTKGQADTIIQIISYIDVNKSIFINSCDTFSIFNVDKFQIKKKDSDIIVFATKNTESDLNTNEGSWIKTNKNDRISKIYLKSRKIENSHRMTGNFYFKNKKIFQDCYNKSKNKLINGEIYIDTLIEVGLQLNFKISVLFDDVYINMGTPKLLSEFNYWNKYFK